MSSQRTSSRDPAWNWGSFPELHKSRAKHKANSLFLTPTQCAQQLLNSHGAKHLRRQLQHHPCLWTGKLRHRKITSNLRSQELEWDRLWGPRAGWSHNWGQNCGFYQLFLHWNHKGVLAQRLGRERTWDHSGKHTQKLLIRKGVSLALIF